MSRCTFCPELGVATTMTTTSNEAFPFLCAQLGVSPPSASISSSMGVGAPPPPALCSGCHSLWEEVSLLYTNMQGLVNLMGRRVQQFKLKNILNQGNGGKNESQHKAVGGMKRKLPSEPEANVPSMLSWWYPSTTGSGNKKNKKIVVESSDSDDVGVGQEEEIKSEPLDRVVMVDDGVGDEEMAIKFEDYEIILEDSENDGGQGQDEDDTSEDPSYDPLQSATRTPSDDPTRCNVTRKKRLTEPNPGLAQTKFEFIPSSKGHPMLFMSGYFYYMQKLGVGKKIWCCSEMGKTGRRLCKARVHTTNPIHGSEDDVRLISINAQHFHPPNYEKIHKLKEKSMKSIGNRTLGTVLDSS